jgi:hypothetical protein
VELGGVITVVRQRGTGDCGLASLATLVSGRYSYEDVFLAAAAVDRARKGQCGMRLRDLRVVALRLGVALELRRRYDLDTDTGILVVHGGHTARDGHCVTAWEGLLVDSADGAIHKWRAYRARHAARFGTLLRQL